MSNSDEWKVLPTAIAEGRSEFGFVHLNNELYLIGGRQREDDDDDHVVVSSSPALDTVISYNFTTGQWTKQPSMPHARVGCAATAENPDEFVL